MKTLNNDEAKAFMQYRYRSLKNNPIVIAIKKLEVGQALSIPREEWKYKSEPAIYFANLKRRLGFSIATRNLPDQVIVMRTD